jgi:hypothetical protein
LTIFLQLSDITFDNYGFDSTLRPFIIDFYASAYFHSDTKTAFLYGSNCIDQLNSDYVDLLSECAPSRRLEIAKTALDEWKFEEKLDKTLEFMKNNKAKFGRRDLDFKKMTRDLEEFVAYLKENVKTLFEASS